MGSKESTIMSKAVGGRVTFRVHHDRNPYNPREEEVLTTIVGWHRKHRISDEGQDFPDRDAFLASVRPEDIVKPLYMYEHGGVVFATTPFSDRWDSGQVGYVLVTRERREAIGLKRSETEQIERNITTEIKAFESYMNGEIYQIDVHRMVDGDVLETPVTTIKDVWSLDDDALDEAAIATLADVDPDHLGDVTNEMIEAADWT